MTRTALTSNRAVYIGDLCYHGNRMAAVAGMQGNEIIITYLDEQPTIRIQTPEGLIRCDSANGFLSVDKTELSDLSDEEKQELHGYAIRGK